MPVTTRKVLRMTFNTATGKTVTLTLPDPKADLTAAQIETVMDQIIAKNLFTGQGGDYLSKQDIKIVDTSTNDLFDPPAA
ncbi:Protein of unknown function (DUF2922) [Acididesulfobacillus acetoxydans]|uniref:DUF2922 domain-containing protein n=1 Tax=Acididesulfobacillus acetoxydans TaxID=1561005 RepID=A0A8S0Y4R5_9FIRM|nr:DUF2922 domain-containing protein [Acididesulfobacillus acetoxydans]CAA7603165.1 Protein of unknown function (DUF2922) [Acididesulfobacillus acetoxydans]CEJ07607.1 Protein of unknown function (DUF2922) [Acididesulfobacillus acetoxydans]